MYGKVFSSCVQGIDGVIIDVEVDLFNGLPQFQIVGLPDSAVRESMERVRSAIKNSGFSFPMERITVNLAPADIRKEGSSFDLAIALGILSASRQINREITEGTLIVGELALNGSLRPVPGVISMVEAAKDKGMKRVFVPMANAGEAVLIPGVDICPLERLTQLKDNNINSINDSQREQYASGAISAASTSAEDYADVQGQHLAKRALMVAAAGMHNILLIGPPGSGKTMLARRLPTIVPPLADFEALEVTKIYSVSGKLADRSRLVRQRPFRSPHHTVSQAGLIGGGTIPKPGEVSLAHRGVLFLDELPEFSRSVLEVLRQPLEDRRATIGRVRGTCSFPAQFILAASMNPCPCGYLGAETLAHPCRCSEVKIQQYRARISGPLLDRIDIQIEVPRIDYSVISGQQKNLSSSEMQERIGLAHELQTARFSGKRLRFNSELSGRLLRQHCALGKAAHELLRQSFDALGLSVRAHDRILKIARTIADLDGSQNIDASHLAEAIQYRSLDRKLSGRG